MSLQYTHTHAHTHTRSRAQAQRKRGRAANCVLCVRSRPRPFNCRLGLCQLCARIATVCWYAVTNGCERRLSGHSHSLRCQPTHADNVRRVVLERLRRLQDEQRRPPVCEVSPVVEMVLVDVYPVRHLPRNTLMRIEKAEDE